MKIPILLFVFAANYVWSKPYWDIEGRPRNPYVKGQPMCHFHGNWELIDFEPMRSKYPPKSESWKESDTTLWVGIASFRDVLCSRTLYNLFTKAEFPDRITVGVVEQLLSDDKMSCLDDYCARFDGDDCPHKDQITIKKVDAMLSTGPTFGRAKQFSLLQDEEFCMQIDSHMDFSQHWDSQIFNQWGMINNEYAVISTYVQDIKNMDKNLNGVWEQAHLCEIIWAGDMPRNEQAKACRSLSEPKLTTIWAAGLSFLKCHGERQTPYDPNLPGIFDGEEYIKGIRLWTRGYDMYTPHRAYIYHDYSHAKTDNRAHTWKRPNFSKSKQRIKTLLEMHDGDNSPEAKAQLGIYGLGTKRTIDQYIDFTGVDIRNRKAFKNGCGNVAWVPFEEDPSDEAIQDNVRRNYIVNPERKALRVAREPEKAEERVEQTHQSIPSRLPVPRGVVPELSFQWKSSEEEKVAAREHSNQNQEDEMIRSAVEKQKELIEIDLANAKSEKEILAVMILIALILFACISYYYHRRDFYWKSYAKQSRKLQIRITPVRDSQSKLV